MASRPPAELEHRRVAQIFQRRIAKGGQKQMLDQFVAQLAAAAVAHHDGGIIGQRQRTGPVREIRRIGLGPSVMIRQPCATPVSPEPALASSSADRNRP